jgi:hypothetical protein
MAGNIPPRIEVRTVTIDLFRLRVGDQVIELTEAELRSLMGQKVRDAFRREIAVARGQQQ